MSGESATGIVSHEQDGRILSGVNPDDTAETLQKVMARHAPKAEGTEAPPISEPAPPSEPPPVEEPPAPPEPAKESRGAKRIAQLTAAQKEEQRARQAVEQERDALKQRIEALEQAQVRAAGAPPQPVATEAPPPQAPPLQQFQQLAQVLPPVLQDFNNFLVTYPQATYNDFELARLQFVDQARAAEFDARFRQSIEADRASRSFLERTEETRVKARGVYPDFDAVVTQGPGASVFFEQPRLDLIINSPHAGHLQYVIAKDAALANRLATCSPYQFAAELAKITPTSAVARPAPTGTQESATPPVPYQPVGTGSTTTTPSSAELIKGSFDFDKSGYREKRAAERGLNSRRR